MNKTNMVSSDELLRVKQIVRSLQPKAKLLEANFSQVELSEILDTNRFDMENVLTSAGWFQEIDKDLDELEENEKQHQHKEDCECEHCKHENHEEDEHENHKHHHSHEHDHHHEHGETEEYGIGTFVYFRRKPFDRLKFEDFTTKDFGKQIIRTKGLVYFENNKDMSYIYEQAGKQKVLTENGPWYATMPKRQIEQLLLNDEKFRKDWDEQYGDRMIKLVFIGQNINKEKIIKELDKI